MSALCDHGLVAQALTLTQVTESGVLTSQLSLGTFYGLIRLLTACVTASPAVAEELLRSRVSSMLRNLLSRWGFDFIAGHLLSKFVAAQLHDSLSVYVKTTWSV